MEGFTNDVHFNGNVSLVCAVILSIVCFFGPTLFLTLTLIQFNWDACWNYLSNIISQIGLVSNTHLGKSINSFLDGGNRWSSSSTLLDSHPSHPLLPGALLK